MLGQAGVDLATLSYPAAAIVPFPVNPTGAEGATYDVLEEVATPSGGTEFEMASADRSFMGETTLSAELPPAVTTTGLILSGLPGAAPQVDTLVVFGDAAMPDEALELALITAVDDATGALTLLRGVLDTVPLRWPAGTTVGVTTRAMWRPLPREYTDQQSLTVKFLTATSSGMLEEYEAPAFTGTVVSRATRPTRGANVRVGGLGLDVPDTPLPVADVVVTWSHRNRLLEDAAMYAWDAASLTPETGTTYTVSLYGEDDTLLDQGLALSGETWTYPTVDELALGLLELPYSGIFDYSGTLPAPGPRANSTLRVVLDTHRDGEDAWQSFDHTRGRAGYGYGYGTYYGGT